LFSCSNFNLEVTLEDLAADLEEIGYPGKG